MTDLRIRKTGCVSTQLYQGKMKGQFDFHDRMWHISACLDPTTNVSWSWTFFNMIKLESVGTYHKIQTSCSWSQ